MKYLALIIIFFAAPSFAEVAPHIDPIKKPFDIKMSKQAAKCANSTKTLWAFSDCTDPIRLELSNTGDWYGTEEYRDKHFKGLSIEELKELYSSLALTQGSYRDTLFKPKLGEITYQQIGRDLDYIELELSRLWRNIKKNHYHLMSDLKRQIRKQKDQQ